MGWPLTLPAKLLSKIRNPAAAVARAFVASFVVVCVGYLLSGNLIITLANTIFCFPLTLGITMMYTGWRTDRRDVKLPIGEDMSETEAGVILMHRFSVGLLFACLGFLFALLALLACSFVFNSWAAIPIAVCIAFCAYCCFHFAYHQYKAVMT